MKKAIKATTALFLIAGMMSVCFTTTSCASSKSSESMYRRSNSRAKIVKRNYKVRGNNQNTNNTYHAY